MMSEIGNGMPSVQETRAIRMAKFGLLAIIGVLAMYKVAGSTGERTPLEMPAGAHKLPWPNSSFKAFLVPPGTADQANCGHNRTFLGSLYDDSVETSIDVITPGIYERVFQKASGQHSAADLAAARSALAEQPHGQVAICPSAPSVRYFQP